MVDVKVGQQNYIHSLEINIQFSDAHECTRSASSKIRGVPSISTM
jgi:hypothetical protein